MTEVKLQDRLQEPKPKKLLTLVLVGLLLMTGIWAIFTIGPSSALKGYETGAATIEDLLASTSVMNATDEPLVVSDSDPNYALISTPVALHYNGAEKIVQPLLVFQGTTKDRYTYNGPSGAVNSFFSLYQPESLNTSLGVTIVGDVATHSLDVDVNRMFGGSTEKVSKDMAQFYWTASDGVILVEDTFEGYSEAINAVSLASYLSIPVIVTSQMNDGIADILGNLGVKYSIVCGNFGGYGKTMHFATVEDAHDTVIEVLKEKQGTKPRYIALGNPLDTTERVVLNSEVVLDTEGMVQDSGASAYPGAAPSGDDGPIHNFTIPYKYTNLKVDIKLDVSEAGQKPWRGLGMPWIEDNADGSGERLYAFIGMDPNGNGQLEEEAGELQFFGGTPGYGFIRENADDPTSKPLWGHFYIEMPFVNEPTPEHLIQLLARLPTDPDASAKYKIKIVAEELEEPIFPLDHGLSSMAPYLAAYRLGVVLAKADYQLHSQGYIGCSSCGVAAANENVTETANQETFVVKRDVNQLLGKFAGLPVNSTADIKALAEHYAALPLEEIVHLGIIADANMIPQYYYPSSGQGDATEGFGIPSDIIYDDIDVDPEDVPYALEDGAEPSFEVPSGRVDGWDVQDVSALLARTFFYHDIIQNLQGPLNTMTETSKGRLAEFWRDSGVTTMGTEPPIGSAYPTTDKITMMYRQTGMETNPTNLARPTSLKYQYSRRQYAQDFYESANLLFFCAHGFYYWYVPTAWESHFGITSATSGGGAFDVAHVKDFSMGPGVIFGSSCVTGRIDGLPGRNTLSLAFMHAGTNAYVGATRMSWGSLIPIPDEGSGEALGDFLALLFYAGITGYIYNKDSGLIDGWEVDDATTGYALMDAKNRYIEHEGGYDNGGTVSDTFEEFILHGDPAFNPYTPDHPDTPS